MKSRGDLFGDREAVFSDDREYRYTLWQWWDREKPYVMFVGLNPSTADEITNDPTVRRCLDFAKRWDYGGFCMTNLFAYRATAPQDMKAQQDPIGPLNDKYLAEVSDYAGLVVVAWGCHGKYKDRDQEALTVLRGQLHCLGVNQDRTPKHPLYIKRDVEPIPYG